jgi:hypothetical protein
MNLQDRKENESCTRTKWRTFEDNGGLILQEMWVRGKRVVRALQYGTVGNSHAQSRWRVAGYINGKGQSFDCMKDALA